MSENRQKGVVFSVRFTADELAQLQQGADRQGCTISTFIREAALCAELRDRPGATVSRDPRTGAEIVTWTRVTPFAPAAVDGPTDTTTRGCAP